MANDIKIHLRQISASASEAIIGRHRVPVDRPEAKGGTDAGPMGGELFLAAVGGCFMSNLLAAIRARQADISDVSVEVLGSIADSPARFTGVELRVTARAGDQELLKRLAEIADRGCIMMNTLRGTIDVRLLIVGAIS
jgi:putative redox protein